MDNIFNYRGIAQDVHFVGRETNRICFGTMQKAIRVRHSLSGIYNDYAIVFVDNLNCLSCSNGRNRLLL